MRARVLLALVLGPIACPAADPALQAVFQHMDKVSLSFKGLTADLVRIRHDGFMNLDDRLVGTIALRRSGPHTIEALQIFNTENGNPCGEQWEIGATDLTIYRAKANVKTVTALTKRYRGLAQAAFVLFGGSSSDLLHNYTVAYGSADAVEGQVCVRLVLNPKEPEFAQLFPKLELWISDATGIVVQEKLYEKGEKDYHLQTYSNMKLGTVAEAQVKLKAPKDAKVEYQHE